MAHWSVSSAPSSSRAPHGAPALSAFAPPPPPPPSALSSVASHSGPRRVSLAPLPRRLTVGVRQPSGPRRAANSGPVRQPVQRLARASSASTTAAAAHERTPRPRPVAASRMITSMSMPMSTMSSSASTQTAAMPTPRQYAPAAGGAASSVTRPTAASLARAAEATARRAAAEARQSMSIHVAPPTATSRRTLVVAVAQMPHAQQARPMPLPRPSLFPSAPLKASKRPSEASDDDDEFEVDEGNRMAILASTTNEDVQARRATTAYVAPGAPARRSVASAIAESSEGRKSLGAQRVTKRLRFNGGGDEAPPASSASQAPAAAASPPPPPRRQTLAKLERGMDQLFARQSMAPSASGAGGNGALAMGVRPFTPMRPHAHSVAARRTRMDAARRIGDVLAELQATPPDDAPQRPYMELIAPRQSILAPMTPRSAALLRRSPRFDHSAAAAAAGPSDAGDISPLPRSASTSAPAAAAAASASGSMNLLLHEINQLAELELELEHALTQELRTGAAAAPVRASPRLQKARALQHGLDGLAPKENLAHAGNVQQEETPMKGLADLAMRSLTFSTVRTPLGKGAGDRGTSKRRLPSSAEISP